MQSLFADLGNILRGVYLIRDVSERITDTIVSYGERCAALMVANMLVGAKHYEAMDIMRTECQFGKHVVDFEETNSRIRGVFGQHEDIAVLGGFIAKDRTTENITNLGRGGSDYTAAVVAAALNASCLEIWTDVDGFMTADPTIVDTAYTIEELNFTEAMELCNFGVRVIYPPTIFPVYHKNIPIRIKNTFNPTAKGTYISAKTTSDPERPIKGISSINDMALLTVQGFQKAYASISVPNPSSVAFHRAYGFREVACFEHVGYKLGSWRDLLWMEKRLAPLADPPALVRMLADCLPEFEKILSGC